MPSSSLLDFLSSPEAATGIGLLAAAGPTTDPNATGIGARLAQATGYANASRDQSELRDLKKVQLQVAKRKADQDAAFSDIFLRAFGAGGATPPPGAGAAPPAAPMIGAGAMGAPGAENGATGLQSAPGAPPMAGAPMIGPGAGAAAANPMGRTGGVAASLTPDMVLAASLAGKDISKAYEAAQPEWKEISPGQWVNLKSPQFNGGYTDVINVSPTTGAATRVYMGQDGQRHSEVISGSLDTVAGISGAQKRGEAPFTAGKGGINPINNRPYPTSLAYDLGPGSLEAQLRGGQGGGAPAGGGAPPPVRAPMIGPGTGMRAGRETSTVTPGATDGGATPADLRGAIAQIQKEMANATDPQSKAMMQAEVDDLQRQIAVFGTPADRARDTPAALVPVSTAAPLIGGGRGVVQPPAGGPPPVAGPVPAAPMIGPRPPVPLASGGTDFSPAEKAAQEAAGKFQTGISEKTTAILADSQKQAQSAASTLQNVAQMKSGVDKAVLGPGANVQKLLLQIGQRIGWNGADDTETLQNTQSVIQGLAKQELAAAAQIAGQGPVTENERGLLKRAESGDIGSLTGPELKTLMNALEKSADWRLKKHEELINRAQGGESGLDLMRVKRPESLDWTPPAGVKIIREK